MFTHCRWKPFQNHLPSGCRYCRLTSDIHDIYVFTQEFFTGSPDMLPILKTPNISTTSTNRNLKNFQEVFMLSRTVFGSTNMLTLWRLVRNATYLISLNLLHFRNIHTLVVFVFVGTAKNKQGKKLLSLCMDHHGRLSCDWKFSRVDFEEPD